MSGIHHITAITRNVQANVDFYVGFLGLRLVKRSGGFEDAQQLHLMYGDSAGSPGSLVTFLVWEDGSQGRVGLGQVIEISFAVAPDSLGFWIHRGIAAGVPMEGPRPEFGEPVLRLRDPDRIIVKLVGAVLAPRAAAPASKGIPIQAAISRMRGATLLSEMPEQTIAFVQTYFGYQRGRSVGPSVRLASTSGDIIDVQDAAGFWPGVSGAGVVDHIAFRVPDREALQRTQEKLTLRNSTVFNSHDRKYFHSLYVREPGNTLFELATDGPGMTVDEPMETLGSELFVPPDSARRAADLKVMLPQFALPGESRARYVELPFVHRFSTPQDPDGSTIVLLHGSGGNESDLMPLASQVAPRSTLLGVRGRSTEEQNRRWFRRSAEGIDEADIRFEAEAFISFLEGAIDSYRIDAEKLVFLGYSNGANFVAAVMLLHPGPVRKALLFRPSLVLPSPSGSDLRANSVVLVIGTYDGGAPEQRSPQAALKSSGANVSVITVRAGHPLSDGDVAAGRKGMALLLP